jgi:hypothetical protein
VGVANSSANHEMTPVPVSVRSDSLAERGEFELSGDFINGQ